MKTDRITLRPWRESDAETLFLFAKDPDVGPRAGWRPHASEEESRAIILSVFSNYDMGYSMERDKQTYRGYRIRGIVQLRSAGKT